MFRKFAVTAATACAVLFAAPAQAIDKCKVKISKTGVIDVAASGVTGILRWGSEAGAESNTFFNAGTCVADGKAKACQFADPLTLAAKTPPQGCTIYLDDDGAACSAWIRGCTPGARGAEYSDFFALMPPDNAATVAPGTAVSFPQNGPSAGSILRAGPSQFVLPDIGTYEVQFVVPVIEAGQLVVALDGLEVGETRVGRATGTSSVTGVSLVTATVPGTLLEIRNPAGNPAALTITPFAGGNGPSAAHLVIKRL
ncbi:MAG: collagen-like protein [Candidatus Binatia bacterium]